MEKKIILDFLSTFLKNRSTSAASSSKWLFLDLEARRAHCMYFCIYLIKCIFYCLNTQNNKHKESRDYIWNQVWNSYIALIIPIQCFIL